MTNNERWLYANNRNKDVECKKIISDYAKVNYIPDDWDIKLYKKFQAYFSRALNRNRGFTLTPREFEQFFNRDCVYCGSHDTITIDRIDNTIGYTLENSQPCCNICNSMKYVNTEFNFLEQINKIYEYKIKSKEV